MWLFSHPHDCIPQWIYRKQVEFQLQLREQPTAQLAVPRLGTIWFIWLCYCNILLNFLLTFSNISGRSVLIILKRSLCIKSKYSIS